MGIQGKEKADEVAKESSENVDTQRCPEQFASFTYVSRTVTKRKWKEPKHWFRMKSDRCPPLQRARYDPALESQEPDMAEIQKEAQISRRYYQLNQSTQ